MNTKKPGLAIGLILVAASSMVRADVRYDFSFFDLRARDGATAPDFGVTLIYSDFLVQTGMNPLSGAALPTPLGMAFAYAGTNIMSSWAFDDDASSVLTDNQYLFNGNSLLFAIGGHLLDDYIRVPGTYFGNVFGNAPFSPDGYQGFGRVTVSLVPEPASYVLTLAGLVAIGGAASARGRARVW